MGCRDHTAEAQAGGICRTASPQPQTSPRSSIVILHVGLRAAYCSVDLWPLLWPEEVNAAWVRADMRAQSNNAPRSALPTTAQQTLGYGVLERSWGWDSPEAVRGQLGTSEIAQTRDNTCKILSHAETAALKMQRVLLPISKRVSMSPEMAMCHRPFAKWPVCL